MTKVLLLCPPIAELWGRRVTQYLDADVFQTSGMELRHAGDSAGAQAHFAQAIEVLPGDVSALKQLGSPKAKELTQCR